MPVKKSGIKLHIAVDALGLPHGAIITPANVTDRDGAAWLLFCHRSFGGKFHRLKKLLVDGGYTGKDFARRVMSLVGAEVEVAKRNELHKFVVLPKRWIVERTFGWLDKCRRLWKNCERKSQNSLQMVVLAFIRLLLKRY